LAIKITFRISRYNTLTKGYRISQLEHVMKVYNLHENRRTGGETKYTRTKKAQSLSVQHNTTISLRLHNDGVMS